MRFTHNGHTYGLSFQRSRKDAPEHVQMEQKQTQWIGPYVPITRMVTTAFLHKQVGPKEWYEVGRASASRNHKDEETKNQGRLRAMAYLAPFIAAELRPLMFKAYFDRVCIDPGTDR